MIFTTIHLTTTVFTYCLTAFCLYIVVSTSTEKNRYFTYLVVTVKLNNCVLTFMWSVMLQPEFLDEVICLRMHGVASILSDHGMHLCVCVTVIFMGTTCLAYLHLLTYFLLSFRFPHSALQMFSPKYLTFFTLLYTVDAGLIFFLAQSSVNPGQGVLCYVLPTKYASKYVAIASVTHLAFVTSLGLALILVLLLTLRKAETLLGSIPVALAVVPFSTLFIWSLFTSTSSSFAFVANAFAFVAVAQCNIIMITALGRFRTYRRAVIKMVRGAALQHQAVLPTT
uniref:G protein-coupled receptor n=1 Tax=Steinernema glaseri TaxID=37863 RepID=A0A1I8A2R6_9BILA